MTDIDTSRLVFIGGLHRSGTTALGRVLAAHPEMSGLVDTGVEEDEGQHLQDVYPAARLLGGPGRFARATEAHLGPTPRHGRREQRERLLRAWLPHWDTDRRYLVEKSPPNLIMGRYLQSVFPGSSLIVIVRHPVVVTLSTKKWRKTSTLESLAEHWFIAHELFREDASALDRLHVLRYEDLVLRTAQSLAQIEGFLGLQSPLDGDLIDSSRSDRYVDQWKQMENGSPAQRYRRKRIERRYSERAWEYGYDMADVQLLGRPWFEEIEE